MAVAGDSSFFGRASAAFSAGGGVAGALAGGSFASLSSSFSSVGLFSGSGGAGGTSLAAFAAAADGETKIINAGRLRLTESDRLGGTARMLRALGADARVGGDSLVIRGRSELAGGTAETESDHRMAMAAAVAACACREAVTVTDPGCVSKSYPGFWDDLSSLEADT